MGQQKIWSLPKIKSSWLPNEWALECSVGSEGERGERHIVVLWFDRVLSKECAINLTKQLLSILYCKAFARILTYQKEKEFFFTHREIFSKPWRMARGT